SDTSVNPDEAVASGAAIQAGILGGEVKDLLLLDVIPLSLGLETLGGIYTKVIERNTTIPTSRSQMYSTAVDGQTSVEIHVLQGERAMVKDNKSLGKFLLKGIPPAPRGVPQIEVNFDIDANGILKVKALDLGTGREQSIEISNTGGLNEAEIQRMQKEAEIYAEQDIQQQKLAELRNQADTLLYNYEATIKEHGDFIDEELATELEESYGQLKQVLVNSETENNYDQLNQQIEEFRQKLFALGETLYDRSGGEKIESPEKEKIPQLPQDSEITEEDTLEQETLEQETNTSIDSNQTKKEATSVKVEESTEEPESEFGKNPFL
ncbi:MAG: Hsp70 family protein, partial [Okeania sp. SIO2D1]|nr:Hsp70 family protein [Okeania sp. SIO2D1]